jgi:hypothetical protein
LDAGRALVVGVPFVVLVGLGGYGHARSLEDAGEAAAAPLLATVIVMIAAASWRTRLRWGELAVVTFLVTAVLYGAARHQ